MRLREQWSGGRSTGTGREGFPEEGVSELSLEGFAGVHEG